MWIVDYNRCVVFIIFGSFWHVFKMIATASGSLASHFMNGIEICIKILTILRLSHFEHQDDG